MLANRRPAPSTLRPEVAPTFWALMPRRGPQTFPCIVAESGSSGSGFWCRRWRRECCHDLNNHSRAGVGCRRCHRIVSTCEARLEHSAERAVMLAWFFKLFGEWASSPSSAESYDAQRKSAPAGWFRNDPRFARASSVSDRTVERKAEFPSSS